MISSRDARSCASSSAVLPPSLSLVRAILVSPYHCFSLLILRRQPVSGHDPRMPAEFGDDCIAGGDAHVIDAGAAATRDLAGLCDEAIAELAWLDEGDLA